MQTQELEIKLSDKQIDLIAHSLGINYYNAKLSDDPKYKSLPDEFYRNYFCVGDPNQFTDEMRELEEAGFIETWNKFGNFYFGITKNGIEEFRVIFLREIYIPFISLPKTKSRSKARYREFLNNDGYYDFAESIGIQKPRREHENGLVRFASTKYSGIKGELCKTIKEAKVSYKEALKKFKSTMVKNKW